MWYEIIPSFAVITLAVAFPAYFFYPLNWLVTGHFYRRSILDKHEALQYLRDNRLLDPYKVLGLENIPDDGDVKENGNDNGTEDTGKGENGNDHVQNEEKIDAEETKKAKQC